LGYGLRHGFTLTADVTIPAAPANGVILAYGGKEGGYTLYVKNGHATFEVNAYGNSTGKIVSPKPLAPGKTQIAVTVDLEPAPPGAGLIQSMLGQKKGTAHLSVNGEAQGSAAVANFTSSYSETLDVGKDLGTPVSRAYQSPFAFNGDIDTVTLDVK